MSDATTAVRGTSLFETLDASGYGSAIVPASTTYIKK